jgi:putative ATP-dependent endonuclease of OLD family
MHVSRLYIENFRSIKQVDLKFTSNKNIIIGKNNSGKSNIMRAIDLMLGEKSPTYVNSDNITEDDFFYHDGTNADEIYIWVELDRSSDPKEEFDYDLLYGAFGYYVYTQYRSQNSPLRIPVESKPAQYKSIFDIDQDNDEVNKFYVNPKLRSQGKIEEQIEDKFKFAFAFRAIKDGNGHIKKEMRLLYREGTNEDGGWVLAFKDSIRTELLQSAIVPAFRDPATQLRLNNWSWFGRLMKNLTEAHSQDQQLKDALNNVKRVSDVVFDEVQQKINASSIDVAFPGAKISFQFSGDANRELYKSARIFVDDGFKSELERKGTGIQSATVIGLFNYYVNVISAKAGAILCVEEPELYLHPHAKRVLSDRLDDFIDARDGIKNQVVITTHSTEFIRSQKGNINIIRIARDGDATKTWTMTSQQTKKFVINPSQAELVFADKVIICEGYDKALLDCLGDKLHPQ